jgi:hypothetical protein
MADWSTLVADGQAAQKFESSNCVFADSIMSNRYEATGSGWPLDAAGLVVESQRVVEYLATARGTQKMPC